MFLRTLTSELVEKFPQKQQVLPQMATILKLLTESKFRLVRASAVHLTMLLTTNLL